MKDGGAESEDDAREKEKVNGGRGAKRQRIDGNFNLWKYRSFNSVLWNLLYFIEFLTYKKVLKC